MAEGAAGGERAVVDRPSAVTAAWLTAVLRERGHDVEVAEVRSAPIGTGQSAHSERFELRYARWDGAAPRTMVGKFPSPDPTARRTGHEHRSYEREVRFYREIAPTVGMRTPECIHAELDPETSAFVLLLEDLSPARQGDQMSGSTGEVAEAAMREAARLHASRWGDRTLEDCSFLVGAHGQVVPPELFASFWAGFLERYRDRLEPDVRRVGEGLAARFERYSRPYEGPRCVTHGDYRLDNLLIDDRESPPRLAVVDWATAGIGCGASDVAYFLGAGLAPDARREHEARLVERYHAALLAEGVRDYPLERAWSDYRRYAYAGYVMAVVASMLVARTERGDDMFMTMAHRHGRQALELASWELLD